MKAQLTDLDDRCCWRSAFGGPLPFLLGCQTRARHSSRSGLKRRTRRSFWPFVKLVHISWRSHKIFMRLHAYPHIFFTRY